MWNFVSLILTGLPRRKQSASQAGGIPYSLLPYLDFFPWRINQLGLYRDFSWLLEEIIRRRVSEGRVGGLPA